MWLQCHSLVVEMGSVEPARVFSLSGIYCHLLVVEMGIFSVRYNYTATHWWLKWVFSLSGIYILPFVGG